MVQHLSTISIEKAFKKGTILISEGQKVDKVYFVLDGCLRSYCLDKNGKEHTLQFAIHTWWISDFIAIYSGQPAQLIVECLRDAQVIEFSFPGLMDLLEKFPALETFQRHNLERHMVSLEQRIINQLKLSAAERYQAFLDQYSEFEQYIPNYHIASYLGITQESLSRIRVNLANS